MVPTTLNSGKGCYFVRGSRVSLDSIVYGLNEGGSPEAIRDSFPTLSLEQVRGAIDYYSAHRAEVDQYLKEGRELFEAGRASQSHVSSELAARLERARNETRDGGLSCAR